MARRHMRFQYSIALAALIGSAPVTAQSTNGVSATQQAQPAAPTQTPPAPAPAPAPAGNAVGPPQLRDFSLGGTVTRPAETPATQTRAGLDRAHGSTADAARAIDSGACGAANRSPAPCGARHRARRCCNRAARTGDRRASDRAIAACAAERAGPGRTGPGTGADVVFVTGRHADLAVAGGAARARGGWRLPVVAASAARAGALRQRPCRPWRARHAPCHAAPPQRQPARPPPVPASARPAPTPTPAPPCRYQRLPPRRSPARRSHQPGSSPPRLRRKFHRRQAPQSRRSPRSRRSGSLLRASSHGSNSSWCRSSPKSTRRKERR